MPNNSHLIEGLYVGNRLSFEGAEKLSMKFYLPLSDLLKQLLICGDETSKYNEFVKSIVEELVLKGIPSLLVDLKGDISSLALLFEKESDDFEGALDNSSNRWQIQEAIKNHFKELYNYGLRDDDIKRFKTQAEIAIFTPRSGRGIPLAISSLIDPPDNLRHLYETECEVINSIIDSIVYFLLYRLYPVDYIKRENEKKFLAKLILKTWLDGISMEGFEGFRRFIELVKASTSQSSSKEADITMDEGENLVKKLDEHMYGSEKIWNHGIPLDIDLLCYKIYRSGKTRVSIINLTELKNKEDRDFVVFRVAYTLYCWMSRKKVSAKQRLNFYIEGDYQNITDDASYFDAFSKKIVQLSVKQAKTSGIYVITALQNLKNVDVDYLRNFGVLCLGRFSSDEHRDKMLDLLSIAGIKADKLDMLLSIMEPKKFLLVMPKGDLILLKAKPPVSFQYRILPPLPKIATEELKGYSKIFYVKEDTAGQKSPDTSDKDKNKVIMPETIFDKFDFSTGKIEPFVLNIEPEEIVNMCLKELSEEAISPVEIKFRHVQFLCARVHRTDWKVNVLARNSLGKVTEHMKKTGVQSTYDYHTLLDELTKDKITEIASRDIHPRCEEICKKTALILPDERKINRFEVRNNISKELNIPFRDVQMITKDVNVAVSAKLIIEYREQFMECFVDIVNKQVKIDFPVFSKAKAISEIKKMYPFFNLGDKNINSKWSFYIIKYTTQDHNYLFKISKKSCKIVNQKIFLTEAEARRIAMAERNKEPFNVWRYLNTWNFYYKDGLRLILEDESDRIIAKQVVSYNDIIDLAKKKTIKLIQGEEFSFVQEEFIKGKWFFDLESRRCKLNLEIDENGIISYSLRLSKEYCLKEARKILNEYKLQGAIQREENMWEDGWEFDFLSSLGSFGIRISQDKKEFIKKELTSEGIKHFAQLAMGGGEISLINDRNIYWEIILRKKGKLYIIELSKQDCSIRRVRARFFVFWITMKVNADTRESNADFRG